MNLLARSFLAAAGAVLLATAPALHATPILTGPFTGNLSETWESFTPTSEDNGYALLPDGTLIMGGAATLSTASHGAAIFGPTYDNGYGVGHLVVSSDGQQGMGLYNQHDSVTITFLDPITAFGGYFAAYGATITMSLSDGSSLAFNYGQQNTGAMTWFGWTSDVAITSVSWSGEFVAVDGLQATSAPKNVPEGGLTVSLLGLGLSGLAWVRRRMIA